VSRPGEQGYAVEAAHALCKNVAGAAGVDPALCRACREVPSGRREVARRRGEELA